MAEQREIIHDSQNPYYRFPLGSASSEQHIRLGLDVSMEETVSSVMVRIWRDNVGEILIELKKKAGSHYEVFVPPQEKGCLLWYYFIINTPTGTFFYGNNPEHFGGQGQCYDQVPPAYQITVVYQGSKTPDWFKHAVMYQIFPDRFRRKGDRIIYKKGAVVHAAWEDSPCYYKDVDTKEIVAYDFFGGNLAGINEKLEYLKEMGISVIYLNPIFESPSNHHYDTGDYHKIDPLLGTNEEFSELCKRAESMGIHIIIDGVFSHTGSDSRYFNRDNTYDTVGAFQSTSSPYYSWYSFNKYPYEYDCWWGFHTLPNVNETSPSYMRFIIEDDDSVMKHWLKAGISGWRLDVIDELPPLFSQRFYKVLKEENPDAVMIGEVWEDASNKISYGVPREYLCGKEMDSAMNYPFRQILLDFLLGRIDAHQVNRQLLSLKENYPPENFYAMMNLIGSHDVERALTLLGEAPYYEGMPAIRQSRFHLDNDHFNLGIARMMMAALWQMTFPGVPCIYYGDEIGMQGYKDPYNRRAYKWEGGDTYLQSWYKKFIKLRNDHPALQTGEFIPLYDQGDIYAYARLIRDGRDVFGASSKNDVFIIVLNRNKTQAAEIEIDMRGLPSGNYKEVFGKAEIYTEGDQIKVQIQALQGLVFRREKEKSIFQRRAGILLHPTSLPSEYGIGDFGPDAYAFIDFLHQSGQHLWQILPLNPVGYGYSPYQSSSAFAGNPLLLSPAILYEDGLIDQAELAAASFGYTSGPIDYERVWGVKAACLRAAFAKFAQRADKHSGYHKFCEHQAFWLDDYALFTALKKEFDDLPWTQWEAGLKTRNPETLSQYRKRLSTEIEYQKFLQYEFFRQWHLVRDHANRHDVKIIGDMPIFISLDSADVWLHQDLFEIDATGKAIKVAGVPPDYFSETGQLWGNPHYCWDKMKKDDYDWWRKRFKVLLEMVDIIRVDHFRGFESYWEIDGEAKTAMEGKWVKGPGREFFQTLEKYFGQMPIIAEDLGIITPEVEQLRRDCGFPGMRVLHFALQLNAKKMFGFACGENAVVYTGTHDNNTTMGWVGQDLDIQTADILSRFIGAKDHSPEAICDRLIEFAYAAPAATAIIPMQDILHLGDEARMNRPGTVGTNWQWRVGKEVFSVDLAKKLSILSEKYKR
jgi:4-alpha-glucanotransferase